MSMAKSAAWLTRNNIQRLSKTAILGHHRSSEDRSYGGLVTRGPLAPKAQGKLTPLPSTEQHSQ